MYWGFLIGARFLALLGLLWMSAPEAGLAQFSYRTASPQDLVVALKAAPAPQRNEVVAAMIERRAQMLPTLRDTLRNGSRGDKMFAASMIAEMRDRDSVDVLIEATGDDDVKVRRRAATVLRILADRRAAARLRALVRTDTDLAVVRTALAALGRIGLQRDAQLISGFLSHQDHNMRIVAAAALAMLGDERGVDLVLQATESDEPGVRKNATYALGYFTTATAGARLVEILSDPNGAWKSYALVALSQQQLATQSLTEQLETLDGLANGRSRVAAEWAVDQLTDIGNAEAVGVLRKVRGRSTPVAAKADRRLLLLEGQP